jgi:hypothetical protein
MTVDKFLLFLVFALSISICPAQKRTTTSIDQDLKDQPPPGNIRLLPGYVHRAERGIDTAVGKIAKPGGMEIQYDIGTMAGNVAAGAMQRNESLAWVKELEVDDRKIVVVYLKEGYLYANVGRIANFIATAKTNEDVADFLIMIMTYGSRSSPDQMKPKSN